VLLGTLEELGEPDGNITNTFCSTLLIIVSTKAHKFVFPKQDKRKPHICYFI
jgi:hypothetical protein